MVNKQEICMIRAKLKDDYVFNAIKNYGYDIHIPYKDRNLLMRVCREIWYRLKIPCRKLWYNSELRDMCPKTIIVFDSLITPDFLEWLQKKYDKSKIILSYENRVDTTISPMVVPKGIELWSYDKNDCDLFGMKKVNSSYFDIYRFDGKVYPKKYDVLYLGRDKGRLEKLLDMKKQLECQGLIAYFHICADRSFLKYKNKNYKPLMSYNTYLEIMKESRAILNIARQDQVAITQREMECVFDNVKCITTNKEIVNFELYHSSRFYILNDENMDGVNDFLKTEFVPVEEELLDKYKFEHVLNDLL